jgi:LacI family transcriptional regulator
MPTIRDVSKLAGVSVATVSRLLNKSGYVSQEAEKSILSAMRELDYSPNEVARSLAGKKSHTIALMVPDILNPYFPRIAKSVEREAEARGYNVLLCDSDHDPAKEERYFETLRRKKMDGIILASYSARPSGLKELLERDFPIVSVDNVFEADYPMLAVTADNRGGARLAVRHLAESGCRRIGHLRGPRGVYTADERYEGYKEELLQSGIFEPDLIAQGDYSAEKAYSATLALLDLHPRIDGLFAGNDLMAAGALQALREAGRQVPGDVKVVGFDGLDMPLLAQELSTISQPIDEMGATAVRQLADLIDGKPIERTERRLGVSLIVRGTTGVSSKDSLYP